MVMRLIKVSDLTFQEVADEDAKGRYLIASHRWDSAQEVDYDDFANGTARSKKGWSKIQNFRRIAGKLDLKWFWIDTCCIKKPDELEACINAMYRYYEHAYVCAAFLEDVNRREQFLSSNWFIRSWTLQELIAPIDVLFFDKNWKGIGSRIAMSAEIARKTGIGVDLLRSQSRPSAYSIAQRMSWAATREATKAEDQAYSLVGLFGVSMRYAYGIGLEKAFELLQKEILTGICANNDHSIFAWRRGPLSHPHFTGLFARTPYEFRHCGDIIAIRKLAGPDEADTNVVEWTNQGIKLTLRSIAYAMNTYECVLNCCRASQPQIKETILLERVTGNSQFVRLTGEQGFARCISSHQLTRSNPAYIQQTFHVRSRMWEEALKIRNGIHLHYVARSACNCYLTWQPLNETKSHQYNDGRIFFSARRGRFGTMTVGYVRACDLHSADASQVRWIKIGFDKCFNPVCMLGDKRLPQRIGREITTNEPKSILRELQKDKLGSKFGDYPAGNWQDAVTAHADSDESALQDFGYSVVRFDSKYHSADRKGIDQYIPFLQASVSLQLRPFAGDTAWWQWEFCITDRSRADSLRIQE